MRVRYSFPTFALLIGILAAGASLAITPITPQKETLAVKPVSRQARNLDTTIPPPEAPVYEVGPGQRSGYLWASGYWDWDGKKHVWQSGRWIKLRPGHVWVASTWAQRGDKWRLYPGHWEKENEEVEPVEEEIVVVESEETVASPAPVAHAKTKHAKRKVRKTIDYNDPKKWPRYRP